MFTGCICGYCIIPGYEAQGTECALLNLHTDEQKICYRKKASRQPGQGKPQPTCKPKGKEKSRLAQGRDSGGGGSHEVFLCSQGYTQQGRALAVIFFPPAKSFFGSFLSARNSQARQFASLHILSEIPKRDKVPCRSPGHPVGVASLRRGDCRAFFSFSAYLHRCVLL